MTTPSDVPDRATEPHGNARLHLDNAFTLLAQHYQQQRAAVRSTAALARHSGFGVDPRPLFDQVTRMEDAAVAG